MILAYALVAAPAAPAPRSLSPPPPPAAPTQARPDARHERPGAGDRAAAGFRRTPVVAQRAAAMVSADRLAAQGAGGPAASRPVEPIASAPRDEPTVTPAGPLPAGPIPGRLRRGRRADGA
ncbi:MAG: hypothetical protein R3F60_24480 [bacterium]